MIMRFPNLVEHLLALPLQEAAPRSVTITRLRDPNGPPPSTVPMIRLRGKWLREFGFDEGGTVRVSAKQGEIRLTVEGHGKQRPAGQSELF
jgi:hypothetical protein